MTSILAPLGTLGPHLLECTSHAFLHSPANNSGGSLETWQLFADRPNQETLSHRMHGFLNSALEGT